MQFWLVVSDFWGLLGDQIDRIFAAYNRRARHISFFTTKKPPTAIRKPPALSVFGNFNLLYICYASYKIFFAKYLFVGND